MLLYNNIIALDIATNVGWACGDGTVKNTQFGTIDLSVHKHDYGKMIFGFEAWLVGIIAALQSDCLVTETPLSQGGRNAYHLAALEATAQKIGAELTLPRFSYANSTIKKFVTGNGHANKKQVMAAIEAKGFSIQTDHEADAIGLLLLTQSKLKGETNELQSTA